MKYQRVKLTFFLIFWLNENNFFCKFSINSTKYSLFFKQKCCMHKCQKKSKFTIGFKWHLCQIKDKILREENNNLSKHYKAKTCNRNINFFFIKKNAQQKYFWKNLMEGLTFIWIFVQTWLLLVTVVSSYSMMTFSVDYNRKAICATCLEIQINLIVVFALCDVETSLKVDKNKRIMVYVWEIREKRG